MSTQKILITHKMPEDWISSISSGYDIIQMDYETDGRDELFRLIPQADALFCLLTVKVDDSFLKAAPRLKVIGNMAVGYDNIDVSACTQRRIPVGNTPGVLTEGTADLAFALLLASARKIKQSNQDILDGKWTTWDPTGWLGADLYGKTLGIIGMGKIGTAVARRAAGFGLKIIYTDTSRNPQAEKMYNAQYASLDSLFASSDFVSVHVPLTQETKHLIDQAALEMMKPGSILVNTARGGIVDQEALYLALTTGQIKAAALDVTTPEPLPIDHPLLHLENCLITPHIGSASEGTRKAMAKLTCQNIIAGLQNKKLPHCVNEEVYQ